MIYYITCIVNKKMREKEFVEKLSNTDIKTSKVTLDKNKKLI